jgi:hypothetical protein
MQAEWTGLRVCPPCLDPRPPQMSPPNVYPEGIPFYDARPPQDGPDRLQDDSYLMATMGGLDPTTGQVPLYPSGQTVPGGALSPQDVIPTPVPSVIVNQDAITLISGPVPAPESPGTPPNIQAT